ncbi:MAG: arginine--tRNA ligase [Thermoplasmata archaeon]
MVQDPWQDVLDETVRLRREAEESLGYPHLDIPFQVPPEGFGDIGFPAHGYSKEVRKPPQWVAEELAAAMTPGLYLAHHEAKSGYVNSFLHYPAFGERTLRCILDEQEDYGQVAPTGKRVIVEHTSINPTGPVHIGRARNSIIGDTLSRLLRRSGYDVTREFLVNDAGKQVLTLVWGYENVPEEELEPPERDKEDHRLVRFYRKASELLENPEVAQQVEEMVRRFEAGDEELMGRVRDICRRMMDGILKTLSRMYVEFDSLFWEDQTILDGSAKKVVKQLQESGHCQEEDGALYVDMEPYGITGRDTRWFITKKDGTTLYTTRDLAYHLDKFRRCDVAINVLGEDQKLAYQQLPVALRLMGVEREVEPIFYAHVSLPEGRLSTRKGRVVNLDDLMDEAEERAFREVQKRREDLSEEEMRRIAEAVGIGALRYNIVKVQPEKRILFRWEEALSLEGQTAPFLQYSYARACGILRKAATTDEWDPRLLEHPQELALLKLIARFPSTVRECAALRRPHQMANVVHELATAFNQFYRDCPVLQAEPPLRAVRLALVEAFRIVLGNALGCLGVKALAEM